jgi:hypothetical protein
VVKVGGPQPPPGTQSPPSSTGTGTSAGSALPSDVFVASLAGYFKAYMLGKKLTTPVSVTSMRSFLNEYGAGFTSSQRTSADTYLDTAQAATTVSDSAAIAEVVFAIVSNTEVPPTIALSDDIMSTHAISSAATTYIGLTEQKTIPPAFWTTLAATLTTLLNP